MTFELCKPLSILYKVIQCFTMWKVYRDNNQKSIRIKSVQCFQVYLDVKYASDPEIKFPIAILRSPVVSADPPFPTAAFGFGNTDLAQPLNPFDAPPSYGAYNLYPPVSGFGNKHQ